MMINAQFKGKFEIKGMSVENKRFPSYNLIRDLVFAHQHSIELYVDCVMRTYLRTHVFFSHIIKICLCNLFLKIEA